MKSIKFLAILFVCSAIISCGQKQTASSDTQENQSAVEEQQNTEEQAVAEAQPTISAQTQARIDKWKNEIFKEFPSKRVSPSDFEKNDFSHLWIQEFDFGYIGTDFQRMYMTFNDVKKISATEYKVSGFSSVKNNYCEFSGIFKILEYHQLKSFQETMFDESEEIRQSIKKQGYIFAEFNLIENKDQRSSGQFNGYLFTKFWIDNTNSIHLLCIEVYDVGNLFLGEWTSHKSGASKPVAWGDYEIPLARGVLYQGDGDICISAKFHKNGWQDFSVCDKDYFY